MADREDNDCVATEESVERVAVSLHHNHLPKLAEFGVVDYDSDEPLVVRTPGSESNDGEATTGKLDSRSHQERYLAELSETDVHPLLAHERRQMPLEVLSELTPPLGLEDHADKVAVRKSAGRATNDEQEASIGIALNHAHLPEIDELALIEYHLEKARVELSLVASSTHGYPAD